MGEKHKKYDIKITRDIIYLYNRIDPITEICLSGLLARCMVWLVYHGHIKEHQY